jgi:acyl carrier protein
VTEPSISPEDSERLRRLIGELAPEPVGPPDGRAHLVNDLGYNSLALAELAIAIADEFGADVDEADDLEPFLDVQTVDDLEAVFMGLVGSGSGR